MSLERAISEYEQLVEVLQMSVDSCGEHGYALLRRIHRWTESHASFVPEKRPDRPPANVQPMVEREVKEFSYSRVPTGRFKGCQVREVPLKSLAAMADVDEFTRELRRYLHNPSIQRLIQEEQ